MTTETKYDTYAILVRVKGGKELKFDPAKKSGDYASVPKGFPGIGKMEATDDPHILVKKLPADSEQVIEIDDALQEQLIVKGQYSTWLLIDVLLTGDPDRDEKEITEKKAFMLQHGEVLTQIESHYNFQIVRIDYYNFGPYGKFKF